MNKEAHLDERVSDTQMNFVSKTFGIPNYTLTDSPQLFRVRIRTTPNALTSTKTTNGSREWCRQTTALLPYRGDDVLARIASTFALAVGGNGLIVEV
jgi:hypothetical protein